MSSFVLASVATARVWYLQTQDTKKFRVAANYFSSGDISNLLLARPLKWCVRFEVKDTITVNSIAKIM